MPRFVFAGAIGASLAYFFDPDNGRKRRKKAIKRTTKAFSKATHLREQEKAQPDDVTLARKVESACTISLVRASAARLNCVVAACKAG